MQVYLRQSLYTEVTFKVTEAKGYTSLTKFDCIRAYLRVVPSTERPILFYDQRTITAVKRVVFTEMRRRILGCVGVPISANAATRSTGRRLRVKQRWAVGPIQTDRKRRRSGASVNFNDSSNSTRRRRRTNERNPFDEITNEPASAAATQCEPAARPTNWSAGRTVQSDGWDGTGKRGRGRPDPGTMDEASGPCCPVVEIVITKLSRCVL